MTGFAYFAILGRSGAGPPAGLAAVEGPAPAGEAVLWDHVEQAWRAGSAAAMPLLHDARNSVRRVPVGRAEAERIAREHLGVELPGEDALRRIIHEPSPPRGPGPVAERDVELENEDWLRAGSWQESGGEETAVEQR